MNLLEKFTQATEKGLFSTNLSLDGLKSNQYLNNISVFSTDTFAEKLALLKTQQILTSNLAVSEISDSALQKHIDNYVKKYIARHMDVRLDQSPSCVAEHAMLLQVASNLQRIYLPLVSSKVKEAKDILGIH